MDAALKAALFVGAVLLLGAGLFARWVGPELAVGPGRSRLRWGLGLGALLLVGAGLAELAFTVQRAFGVLDAGFFQDYALHTRHGQATLARSVLALGLVGMGLGGRLPRLLDHALYGLLGLGVLASLSLVSHSGVMGTQPFLGDLAHLVGAALWAGALLYFAWVPDWRESRATLMRSIRRVSSLGVFGVAVLTLTGLYTSTLHLYGAEALTRTPYGLALVFKVALVLVILAVAAANRWVFMPRLEQGRVSGLRRAVRLESVLLVGVLGATGVLTTREPAHGHGHAATAAQHGPLHEAGDHGLHVAPEPAVRANVFALATGPASVEPLLGAGGAPTLVLQGAGVEGAGVEEGFSAVGPDGARYGLAAERVPTHHGVDELWLSLPEPVSGPWQLLGPLGERFAFTVHEAMLERGQGFTAFFMPTPSLAGGGLSEAFVYLEADYLDAEADADEPRSLFMSYHMPGMEHAGDDERFELEQDARPHDARARAYRASLAFPMTGRWEVAVHSGEETRAHRFTLEVPDEVPDEAL